MDSLLRRTSLQWCRIYQKTQGSRPPFLEQEVWDTGLSVFYRIYHNLSVHKLPIYLQPLDEEDTLSGPGPVINPPTHMTGQDGIHKLSSMRPNQLDKLSLKCSVNKASSPVFKSSFFFRTHLLWNVLPLSIKEASTPCEFESRMKHQMWVVGCYLRPPLGSQPNDICPGQNCQLESGWNSALKWFKWYNWPTET